MINMYRPDGTKIDIQGYRGIKLSIPSPSFEYETEETESGHSVVIDKRLKPRNLEADFVGKGTTYVDSLLLRDEIYRLVAEDYFFITDSHLPHKWWKVRVSESFTPERLNPFVQTYTIPLICNTGLAESEGTTLEPFTHTSEKWQYGLGLIRSDNTKYVHDTPTFKIYNAGDVKIDPRKQPLKIIYMGGSNDLTIKNITTGDEWKYNGSSEANDQITLDGVQSLKNDVCIFGQTNTNLITLAKGWNEFELKGFEESFLISFEHKFYYY